MSQDVRNTNDERNAAAKRPFRRNRCTQHSLRTFSTTVSSPESVTVDWTKTPVLYFGFHNPTYEYMSSFARFVINWNGINFPTSEHYVMYHKALLQGDVETSIRVKFANSPLDARHLGKKLDTDSSNRVAWEHCIAAIVNDANYAKFSQHPELSEQLLATGNAPIGEVSFDPLWAIGLSWESAELTNTRAWFGQNVSGKSLMYTRERLFYERRYRLTSPIPQTVSSPQPPSNTDDDSDHKDATAIPIIDNKSSSDKPDRLICLPTASLVPISVSPLPRPRLQSMESPSSFSTDIFSDPVVLLSGDTWSLEYRVLHPDRLENWRNAAFACGLQRRPELGPTWSSGRIAKSKRNFAFFSNVPGAEYEISRKMFAGQPLPADLDQIMQLVNKERDEVYDAMIINEYEDGKQSIGYHSDNPKHLGSRGVDTLSFGQTRTCIIRKKGIRGAAGTEVLRIDCKDGSLLSMMGDFQTFFTHEISPDESSLARRSVTFRWMLRPS